MNRACTPVLAKYRVASLLLLLCLAPANLQGEPATGLAAAEKALQQGRADEAARLLGSILAAEPTNAKAHELLCRVFYSEELAEQAVRECERAAALTPQSGETQMWLGRAYGLRASNAGPFAGLSLAKKVRLAFESSVQLDPGNVPALAALGEFYTAAPSLVGGGLDKAERIAAQLLPISAMDAHRLRGMIAEKRKDFAAAEAELKLGVAAGRQPSAWVDLGNFYQRQHELEKAVAALQSGLDADPLHDAALMDVASILSDAHRSPEMAERALRLYLASPAKSEAAPAFRVHVQLGRLLAQRGDAGGARQQYEAALALASSYEPARKALRER